MSDLSEMHAAITGADAARGTDLAASALFSEAQRQIDAREALIAAQQRQITALQRTLRQVVAGDLPTARDGELLFLALMGETDVIVLCHPEEPGCDPCVAAWLPLGWVDREYAEPSSLKDWEREAGRIGDERILAAKEAHAAAVHDARRSA